MQRPSEPPKAAIARANQAADVARRAERSVERAGADVSVVRAVEAELEASELVGAARTGRARTLAREQLPTLPDAAVDAVAAAVEARRVERAERATEADVRQAWADYHAAVRTERRREQAVEAAHRLHADRGRVRSLPDGSEVDGREAVIRQIAAGEHAAEALAAVYGPAVAEAYESEGADAAIAALPEVW